MAVVSIFVLRTPEDETGLHCSAHIARRLDRPLEAVCPLPDPAMATAYIGAEFAVGMSGIQMEAVAKAEKEIVAATKDAFDRIIADAGLPADRASFRESIGSPERISLDAALLADAVVFPHGAGRGGNALSSCFEHVMMDNALPVIIAGNEGMVEGPTLIAWDGSAQAARAVAQHGRLARSLGDVVIVQSEDGLKSRPGETAHEPERARDWLAGMGVDARIQTFEGPPGKGMLQLAEDMKAGLIISGAYGHSRAGEFLFGGVTRTLLRQDSSVSLALCH